MDLLLFFAIPVATILLSIVWQKIVRSPFLVAITAFAIFLIFVYSVDSNLLILAVAYTILAFLAAIITKFICENFNRNGIIRNLQAENIQANNIETNNLSTNSFNVDGDNSDNNNNNGNCSCNNRYYTGRSYRNF